MLPRKRATYDQPGAKHYFPWSASVITATSYPPFVPRQPQPPPPPPPEYQGREEEEVDEEEEEEGEYQIEDIEREIQRGGEEKRENAGQNR